jgi:hypothetical protein
VHWHLKRVAQRLAELHRSRRFDRLILAGPMEATTQLRGVLPRPLATRVAAVVPAEMAAGDRELLDLAGPAGRATLGVPPTLAALWSDTVQTLVVAHGVHDDGSECPNCARLDRGRVKSCPACGHAMRPVHDVFHRAMGRAVDQSGRVEVEVLHGAAARRLIELGGGLAAMLRYPTPVPATVAST